MTTVRGRASYTTSTSCRRRRPREHRYSSCGILSHAVAATIVAFLIFGVSTVTLTAAAAAAAEAAAAASDHGEAESCRLYLAESYGGRQPLSVFTSVAIQRNDTIGVPEIGLPLTDILSHTADMEQDVVDLFWTPSEILAQFEDNAGDNGLAILGGVGMAGTTNPGLYNCNWERSHVCTRFGEAGSRGGALDWRAHPGAGATSDYFNMVLTATADIPPGTEIFPYFGEAWYGAQEEAAEEDETLPTMKNYAKADQILTDFAKLVRDHPDYFTPDVKREFWSLLVDDVVSNPKTRMLLPSTPDEAERLSRVGTAYHRHPGTQRTPDWLRTHGLCVDNLRPGVSSVEGAGRGAFAARFLSTGSLVSPGPLVRFSKTDLTKWKFDPETHQKTDEVMGHQLVLNYAFSHPQSSVVLYPYASTVNFINHSSDAPNVKVQWSTSRHHDPSQFLRAPEDLTSAVGLMLDYVALRDIQPGEEVLLDYGPDWEQAWKAHVASWSPPDPADSYVTANMHNEAAKPILSESEQQMDPYGGHLYMICSYIAPKKKPVSDTAKEEHQGDASNVGGTMDLAKVSLEDVDSAEISVWNGEGSLRAENRCQVIERQSFRDEGKDPHDLYFVRLMRDDGTLSDVYLKDVPREAIMFVDAPYYSPMHSRAAFRHFIGLPDDMLPSMWRDIPN